jgi:mannose-1-phosphate guanylyltransferase
MLPVGPKPILEHIIEWLSANKITDIVISTGYLGRMIEEYFRSGSELGVRIEYARSNRPMGIAGQLRAAEEKVGDTFLCLYGDAILHFRLDKLIDFHVKNRAMATMALMKYETKLKYGMIDVDEKGMVASWREKPIIEGDINVGCYVMRKTFFKYIPKNRVYGMKEAFEDALKNKERIYALRVRGTFLDIGDRRSYRQANELYIRRYGEIP